MDWSSYNDRLVREVDVIFDTSLVSSFFFKKPRRLARGCPARRRMVLAQKQPEWQERLGYGTR